MVKVRTYIAALEAGGVREATRITGGVIRTLGESLAAISECAAGTKPGEVRVYHERRRGKPVKRKVERFLMHEANRTLVQHYTGQYARENAPPPQPTSITYNLNVLSLDDLQKLDELRQKLLTAATEEQRD